MASSTVSVVHITQCLRRGGGGRNDVVQNTTGVPHNLSNSIYFLYLFILFLSSHTSHLVFSTDGLGVTENNW